MCESDTEWGIRYCARVYDWLVFTVPTMTFLPVAEELESVNALDGSSLVSCFWRLIRTPLAGGLGASLRLSEDIWLEVQCKRGTLARFDEAASSFRDGTQWKSKTGRDCNFVGQTQRPQFFVTIQTFSLPFSLTWFAHQHHWSGHTLSCEPDTQQHSTPQPFGEWRSLWP